MRRCLDSCCSNASMKSSIETIDRSDQLVVMLLRDILITHVSPSLFILVSIMRGKIILPIPPVNDDDKVGGSGTMAGVMASADNLGR